ncbi:MAG: hypothetical protein PQJ60_08065 [Spirochaetales bacterium]|nr:hypothetical protein [Spirochaetales bacterium]
MKSIKRKYIRLAIILTVAMGIIFAVQMINNRSMQEAMPLSRILIITLISGVCFLPLALFSLFMDRNGDRSQIMAVKEIRLGEEEMKEAAGLWVFTQHGVAPEGDVQLEVGEDGEISCLVHIPG